MIKLLKLGFLPLLGSVEGHPVPDGRCGVTGGFGCGDDTCTENGKYDKCGGRDWDGPTCCPAGYVCFLTNEWSAQCFPDHQVEQFCSLNTFPNPNERFLNCGGETSTTSTTTTGEDGGPVECRLNVLWPNPNFRTDITDGSCAQCADPAVYWDPCSVVDAGEPACICESPGASTTSTSTTTEWEETTSTSTTTDWEETTSTSTTTEWEDGSTTSTSTTTTDGGDGEGSCGSATCASSQVLNSQCDGGPNYNGETCCPLGHSCFRNNYWWAQCVEDGQVEYLMRLKDQDIFLPVEDYGVINCED